MIISFKAGATAALLACSAMLGGCVTDGYGYGPSGYYDGGYYDGGYGGYGGIGYYDGPGYGWYGDYYYPGSGIYVFDRAGRRSRWNDDQRRYWSARRDYLRDRRGDRRDFVQDRRRDHDRLNNGAINPGQFRQERRDARQDFRQDRRQERRAFTGQQGRGPGVSRRNDVRPPSVNQPANPNPNPGPGAGQPRGRSWGGGQPGGGRQGRFQRPN